MQLGLAAKVAIVTGGARGIGLATAHALAAEGCTVAICGRDKALIDEAVRGLESRGATAMGMVADASDEMAMEGFVAEVMRTYGVVDILVNNAGSHLPGTIENTTRAILDRALEEKVHGYFLAMRAVLPDMRKRRDGRIVNIIGQSARHPHPDRLASGVANAALLAMSKSIADAVARDNVRVNSVCPEDVDAEPRRPIAEMPMRAHADKASLPAVSPSRANALGRMGRPGEVADVVTFLVSDRANFICGTSVSVDGGYQRYVFG